MPWIERAHPATAPGARPSGRFNVRMTRVKQATSSPLNDEAAFALGGRLLAVEALEIGKDEFRQVAAIATLQ